MSESTFYSGYSDITDFRELVSSRTRRQLIRCPNGCNIQSVSYEYKVDWKYFTCNCNKCSKKWYICLNCPNQSAHYLCPAQLKRHQRSCKASTCIVHPSANNIIEKKVISYHKFMKFPHFGKHENKEYYYNNQFKNGPSYIVGWSHFHLPNISSCIPKDEVLVQSRIADLMLGLVPKQIEQFVNIMQYLEERTKDCWNKVLWNCSLPKSLNDVRTLYKDGKYAIHKNIPIPSILHIDGHSYVPLEEIFQDALANNCQFEKIYSPPNGFEITCLNESKTCERIYECYPKQRDTVDLIITRWSDDFEPYNIKSNKGSSVWIMTITIYSKHEDKNSYKNTYVVAMGKK